MLFVITPIHEFLHLFVSNPNVLSNRNIIVISSFAISAFYDGENTKTRTLVCLITPFITLTFLFVIILHFIPRAFVLYTCLLLWMHVYGCYRDVLMFCYILLNLPRNCIIYGNRYKMIK